MRYTVVAAAAAVPEVAVVPCISLLFLVDFGCFVLARPFRFGDGTQLLELRTLGSLLMS